MLNTIVTTVVSDSKASPSVIVTTFLGKTCAIVTKYKEREGNIWQPPPRLLNEYYKTMRIVPISPCLYFEICKKFSQGHLNKTSNHVTSAFG